MSLSLAEAQIMNNRKTFQNCYFPLCLSRTFQGDNKPTIPNNFYYHRKVKFNLICYSDTRLDK